MRLRLRLFLPALAATFVASTAAARDESGIRLSIQKIIAAIDEGNDCGEEWRKTWNVSSGPYCENKIEPTILRRYSNKNSKDAFVFFHIGGCCGGSNGATYLAAFSRRANGYDLLGYSGVGYKATPVDTSFLRVESEWIYVRLTDHMGFLERGPLLDSYFTRWRVKERTLVSDGLVYKKVGASFKKVTPNVQ